MQNLLDSLKNYDFHFLQIIANRWDVDWDSRDTQAAAERLAITMLETDRAAKEWQRLKDNERGALQILLANKNRKMSAAQFERLNGEIRQMGEDRRQREKPHLAPTGVAEILYYRGFIYLDFDEAKTGPQKFVYVPADLAAVLPTRNAGYDLSKAEEIFAEEADAEEIFASEIALEASPTNIQRGDTSIVDDLTTLLAFIQINQVALDQGTVSAAVQEQMRKQLLGTQLLPRLELILQIAYEMGLIAESNGKLEAVRHQARQWLDRTRTQQIKLLVEAWNSSEIYNELWHIDGLIPEGTRWQNDPRLLRQALHETIDELAANDWVSIDAFVEAIKDSDPDFQRPGGDYSSWYIRDSKTGNYLQGFENWERIEGAMLRYAIIGPMHWLGLVDLGDGNAFKLNTFGRAWIGRIKWPERPDPATEVTLEDKGLISISRAASRYDRFQLARFTDWNPPSDPYLYKLTSASLKRAEAQGIKVEHIQAFLQRTTGHPLPKSIQAMLEKWHTTGQSSAVLERLYVLQVDTAEMMRLIWETAEVRRFLGRKLGELAVAVRADQWEDLVTILEQQGIPVDTNI